MSDEKKTQGTLVLAAMRYHHTAEVITCEEFAKRQTCDSCGQSLPAGKVGYIEAGYDFAQFLYDSTPGGFWKGIANFVEGMSRAGLQ